MYSRADGETTDTFSFLSPGLKEVSLLTADPPLYGDAESHVRSTLWMLYSAANSSTHWKWKLAFLMLISDSAAHNEDEAVSLTAPATRGLSWISIREHECFVKIGSSQSHWEISGEELSPTPAKPFLKKLFFVVVRSKSGGRPSYNSSLLVLNDWFFQLVVLEVLLVNLSHLGPDSIHYVERSVQAVSSPTQYKQQTYRPYLEVGNPSSKDRSCHMDALLMQWAKQKKDSKE